ncbi:MAG: hypothetical protein QOF14_4392 [Hyphomicrobiales bacterium]|jgi:hypothetical protein|nr:hypothetical protein [Hyphomicrobiales bacterium]
MKTFSTILAAAFLAGSCTLAMAQAGGASGAAGADQSNTLNPAKDADKNPTGAAANPTAGNPGAPGAGQKGMSTAPVAGTPAPRSGTQKDPASPTSGAGAVK